MCRRAAAEQYTKCRFQADGSALEGKLVKLAIHLQSWDDGFTDFLQTTWPHALQRLKAIAETPT